MVNDFIESSPKSNDSRGREEAEDEEEREESSEAREFNSPRGKYQVSNNPSDDETTSSSLIPLPDSLNKMRNELKRTINNIADSPINPLLSSKFATSLEELKKKYTMGKEVAVTTKINSVNTMLDDLLHKNEGKISRRDLDTSTTDESTFSSSTDRCKYEHFITHPVGANVCNFTQHSCFTHDSTCNYVNSSSPMREAGKKRSLLGKIQDFQVKDKIQAVYRSMSKTKSKKKLEKDDKELSGYQGLPPPCEYSEIMKRKFHDTCDMCQPTYHKRLTSAQPQDPHKIKYVYTSYPSDEIKCTCPKQPELRCTCPHLQPVIKSANSKKLSECTCPIKSKRKQSSIFTCPGAEMKCTCPPMKPTITCPAFVQTDPENIFGFRNIQDYQKKPSRRKDDPEGDKPEEFSWEPPLKVEKLTQTSGGKLNLSQGNIDVYYFDHGNSAYYRTTDSNPAKFTEYLIEKTDRYSNKFWAEMFGTVHVVFSFVISFILQLYRFIFTSLIRSLTVGLLQIFSDYFFKPLLTILFNGIIQPVLILAYNIATSLKDLCEPISQTCGFFTRELAHVFRACRLIEYNNHNNNNSHDLCKNSSCTCRTKV